MKSCRILYSIRLLPCRWCFYCSCTYRSLCEAFRNMWDDVLAGPCYSARSPAAKEHRLLWRICSKTWFQQSLSSVQTPSVTMTTVKERLQIFCGRYKQKEQDKEEFNALRLSVAESADNHGVTLTQWTNVRQTAHASWHNIRSVTLAQTLKEPLWF